MTRTICPLTVARTLIASSLVVGCLADPPEYVAPDRVPPVVAEARVEPALGRIIRLEPGVDRLEVTVPFRSEDLGSRVVAAFYLDVPPGSEEPRPMATASVGASTFDDDTRSIAAELTGFSQQEEGCHSLTLVLTHQVNIQGLEVDLLREAEATRVVWWLLLPSADDDDVLLSDCPVETVR